MNDSAILRIRRVLKSLDEMDADDLEYVIGKATKLLAERKQALA